MRVRRTRTWLLVALIAGVALAFVGLLIGISIPGLILGVVGWVIVITALVRLLAAQRTASNQQASWRPGDQE